MKIGQLTQRGLRCSGYDCHWVGKKHGVALAEVARRVGVSTAAVSKIIKRARK
ncbi:MAG: LacI family DNA-binding transcriptional regulator [bacterium]|nr:LacI family DNA-binding transcriptional regulator [bacterium]